jgi:hypothetical protein
MGNPSGVHGSTKSAQLLSLGACIAKAGPDAFNDQTSFQLSHQKRFGIKMPDYVPMTVTDRAYSSPICPFRAFGPRNLMKITSG